MTPEHLHRLAAGIFHLALAATLTVTAVPAQAQGFPTRSQFLIQNARDGDSPNCVTATGVSETALGVSGTLLGTASCTPSDPKQQWTYDPFTSQLSLTLNGQKQCATAFPTLTGISSGLLILASCSLEDSDTLVTNQWFAHTPSQYYETGTAITDVRTLYGEMKTTWLIVDSLTEFASTCPLLLTPPPYVRVFPLEHVETQWCPGVAKPFVRFIPVTP